MTESSVKFGAWYLQDKIKSLTQHFAVCLTQAWPLKFMLVFIFMTHLSGYDKLFESEIDFWDTIEVVLGHLYTCWTSENQSCH